MIPKNFKKMMDYVCSSICQQSGIHRRTQLFLKEQVEPTEIPVQLIYTLLSNLPRVRKCVQKT